MVTLEFDTFFKREKQNPICYLHENSGFSPSSLRLLIERAKNPPNKSQDTVDQNKTNKFVKIKKTQKDFSVEVPEVQ